MNRAILIHFILNSHPAMRAVTMVWLSMFYEVAIPTLEKGSPVQELVTKNPVTQSPPLPESPVIGHER